jgi:glutamine phosphoribosylpyrophosphate amidotransferase
VFHIPGRSSWAGHHRGRDRAIAYIENAREIAHAGKVEVELEAMLVGEDRDNAQPQRCDACFTGDYPTSLTDVTEKERGAPLSLVASR